MLNYDFVWLRLININFIWLWYWSVDSDFIRNFIRFVDEDLDWYVIWDWYVDWVINSNWD